MSEATSQWYIEGTSWLKYAVETQLLNLKSDVLPVIRDKSISAIINRLKDNHVGIRP